MKMASQTAIAMWNVVILSEEQRLSKTFVMPSNTRIDQVMDTWKEECQQAGSWIFVSLNREEEYEGFETLQMIGETVANTGIVTFRVQISDKRKPTTDIFNYVGYDCHHLQVEPNQKLHCVLQHMAKRPTELEYNRLPLDINQTVNESGLENYAVISEPCREINVSVKLSNGETVIFRVPENSYVIQLVDKVTIYETNEFSLIYQGRHLNPQESVRGLKYLVEVARVEFNVHIHGRRVNWITRAEAITFPEFLSQLSVHGKLKREKLETMQFRCMGCERRICKSEESIQLIPIECCAERSLTLIAMSFTATETQLELDSLIQQVKSLYEHLLAFKSKDLNKNALRFQCEKMKESFVQGGWNYNIIIRMCEELQRNIEELIEDLTNKNITSEQTIKALTEEKRKTAVKIETLTRERKESVEELETLMHDKRKSTEEIMALTALVQEMTTVGPSAPPKTPSKDSNVKLLVGYRSRYFSPVESRPEVTHKGKYRWSGVIYHIKCTIPGLSAGWTSFEVVRDALQPLFTKNEIRSIDQRRGIANKIDVAAVTSQTKDEWNEYFQDSEFCSEDGHAVKWEEAGKPREVQNVHDGGRILLCGGQRRTILDIHSSAFLRLH